MFRLNKNVYFQQYGDCTYVRHVEYRKDYLMHGISYELLQYVKSHPGCGRKDLVQYITEVFDIEDTAPLKEEIDNFVFEMLEEHILMNGKGKNKSGSGGTIREYVQEYCCENNRLLSACLELTYRCNEKCIHCYVGDPPDASKELCIENYRNILKQLRDMGCMNVLLTGGEATLHKDFIEIADMVKQFGMVCDIYTNGLDISDNLLDRLAELKPNSISFSFYGGTAEVHDSVTKVSGSFERSLKTMMMCKCAGIDTYIKTVVMRQNFHDFEKLLQMGKRLGIPVTSSLSVMATYGGRSPQGFRLMDVGQYKEILDLEKDYAAFDASYEEGERSEFICASRNTLSIDPFGNIHPCNAHPEIIGNIKTDKLAEVWHESGQLEKSGMSFLSGNGKLRTDVGTDIYSEDFQ